MTRPLRVLELGVGVCAAYAAKLLGDLGADVVKVEPPEGDPTRRRGPFPDDEEDAEKSGTFLALNVNKRGVCLDLAADGGRRDLDRLIGWADVLVHNHPRARADELGLGRTALEAEHPRLVVLSITPFGITGPYRDYRGTELIVANAGGWANLCPGTHAEPQLPPLKVFGHQCAMMAGTAGAMAALAMAREARRSGVGEHIDLSEQEYVASVLEGGIPSYTYRGDVLTRDHPRGLIPWRIFETKDAPIFLACVEQDQWERLVEFMGDPDWAELEVFADNASRAENQDLVHQFIQGVHLRVECVGPLPRGAEAPNLRRAGDKLRRTRGQRAPQGTRFLHNRGPSGHRPCGAFGITGADDDGAGQGSAAFAASWRAQRRGVWRYSAQGGGPGGPTETSPLRVSASLICPGSGPERSAP